MVASKTFCACLLMCLAVYGCSDLFVSNPEVNQNLDDFAVLTQLVKTRYPFLQFKHINWDSLVQAYRPVVAASKGDEIYPVFDRLLAELHDGHVKILTEGGGSVETYEWPRLVDDKTYNPLVVRKYFGSDLRLAGNNNMEYGILPGNIGYCYISTFSEGNGTWPNTIDDVLAHLQNTEGLILDVRNNGGGGNFTWNTIVSRFATTTITYEFYLPDGSTFFTSRIVPSGAIQYRRPVVVLMNGASFSAAELFPELMKQIPAVTTLGDTTGGGGGSNEIFKLPSGKRIQIPTSYFRRFDGTMIEWNGVPPDIYVAQTIDDVDQGRDKQLERAIQVLQ